MGLTEKIKTMSMQERDALAKKAGIESGESLRHIAYGHDYASIDLAEKLEKILSTNGAEKIVSPSNRKILARLRANGNAAQIHRPRRLT